MREVKSNLHVLMGKKKIKSINQLANETGISRPTLTRIYNDEMDRIELLTIQKLCDFFDCHPGDLLVLEDNTDEKEKGE
jgi:putative transcriptional regulator